MALVLGTSTRKKFLLSASGAATAAALGGAGLGLMGGTASARTPPSPEQDIRILTFLLGLQRIERGFYAEAVREGKLQGDFAEYLQQIGLDEDKHIKVLEDELGAPPARSDLHLSVGDAFRDEAAFVKKAAALEDAVVAAHNGQVTNLTPERLQLVCSIVSVEARHSAWIRDLGAMPPAPGATDAPLDADAARNVLRSEGFLT
jgi:hypothetical protein